jgi:hypothetical protein
VSPSFHGRDIFAPIAAALSQGVEAKALGPQIVDEVQLASLSPVRQKNGKVKGRIIHVDHFGNCITNFTRATVPESKETKLLIKGRVIGTFRNSFSEGSENEIFAIWGSAGFLELSTNGRSAAKMLRAKRGDPVVWLGE